MQWTNKILEKGKLTQCKPGITQLNLFLVFNTFMTYFVTIEWGL